MAYPHQFYESIVYPGTVLKEEAASRAEVVEEEKFLLLANLPVIPFGSFSEECLVLGELLLVRE